MDMLKFLLSNYSIQINPKYQENIYTLLAYSVLQDKLDFFNFIQEKISTDKDANNTNNTANTNRIGNDVMKTELESCLIIGDSIECFKYIHTQKNCTSYIQNFYLKLLSHYLCKSKISKIITYLEENNMVHYNDNNLIMNALNCDIFVMKYLFKKYTLFDINFEAIYWVLFSDKKFESFIWYHNKYSHKKILNKYHYVELALKYNCGAGVKLQWIYDNKLYIKETDEEMLELIERHIIIKITII
jgi:hypothetical protein